MSTQDRQPADFVVCGSAVYTLDSAQPWAEAFAVRDGKVVVVGDDADVGAVTGSQTRVIHAEGGMVMPGLIDVHSHVGFGGQTAAWELGLSPMFSAEDILGAVQDRARKLGPLGRGFLAGARRAPAPRERPPE
jgi:hypothetical protein